MNSTTAAKADQSAGISAPDAAEISALSEACHSLWLATLSLMTAFMQTPAPAHRLMLARRIARNFATLRDQEECFTPDARESFARLAARWQLRVERLSPAGDAQQGVFTRLQRLLAR
jgi:hypothetical protein